MSKEYREEYRGFIIERVKDEIKIYDASGQYVKRLELASLGSARVRIDTIITNSRR
jgi:hypothetical protein